MADDLRVLADPIEVRIGRAHCPTCGVRTRLICRASSSAWPDLRCPHGHPIQPSPGPDDAPHHDDLDGYGHGV